MITRSNIKEVVNSIADDDKKRLANTNKEYVVLQMHIFNGGYVISIILTNDYNRYKNVSFNGHCILSTDDEIFNEIRRSYANPKRANR